MKYRTLGRTGLKVSPLCLGAMMFGAWAHSAMLVTMARNGLPVAASSVCCAVSS